MGPVNRPNCVIEKGAGWLGRKVFFGSDKSQFFKNKDDETILFYPLAYVGATWKLMDLDFGNYVQAAVKEVGSSKLFSANDSIKKIELQVFNNKNEAINSKLNGMYFILSKNFGLTVMYNMFHFPDSLGRYNLRGFNNGKLEGIQPITYKDAFDFEIGDEFHIYEGDTSINNEGVLVYRRITVEAKVFFEDENTYDYEVKQNVMQVRFNNSEFDTAYNDNYAHIRIDLNKFTDYTPEKSYFVDLSDRDSTLTSNMIFVGQYDNRQVIKPWIKYDYFKYPCFVYSPNSDTRAYSYIEGCGEFFEEAVYYGSTWKRLMYMKKGEAEWGKPLDFIVGVDEDNQKNLEKNNFIEAKIYPNPISDFATVSFNLKERGGSLNIKIYDITGRELARVYDKVHHEGDAGYLNLDMSKFTAGIYNLVFMIDGVNIMTCRMSVVK